MAANGRDRAAGTPLNHSSSRRSTPLLTSATLHLLHVHSIMPHQLDAAKAETAEAKAALAVTTRQLRSAEAEADELMALHEAGEAQHAAEVAQLNARVASNTAATTAGAEATRLSETERSAIRAECEQKLQFSLDRERAEATLAVERARIEALTATEMLQRIKTDHGAWSDGDLQRQRAHAPLRTRALEYGAA